MASIPSTSITNNCSAANDSIKQLKDSLRLELPNDQSAKKSQNVPSDIFSLLKTPNLCADIEKFINQGIVYFLNKLPGSVCSRLHFFLAWSVPGFIFFWLCPFQALSVPGSTFFLALSVPGFIFFWLCPFQAPFFSGFFHSRLRFFWLCPFQAPLFFWPCPFQALFFSGLVRSRLRFFLALFVPGSVFPGSVCSRLHFFSGFVLSRPHFFKNLNKGQKCWLGSVLRQDNLDGSALYFGTLRNFLLKQCNCRRL